MRRSAFLACTGLTVHQHIYMCRHRHLPFLDSDQCEGWADYSARQVFLTSLTSELAPLVGGQAEAARRVVEFPHAELSRIWGGLFRPSVGDVLAVSYLTTVATDHPRWNVERINWAFSLVDQSNPVLNLPSTLPGAHSVIPVLNLSAIMRAIQLRAVEAGFEFREDIDHA